MTTACIAKVFFFDRTPRTSRPYTFLVSVLWLFGTTSVAKALVPTTNSQCSEKHNSFRVLILRHGQTDANAGGIIQGSSDISRLTELGKQQAIDVVQSLQDEHEISAIYCSPLTRARETLQYVQQHSSLLLSTLSNTEAQILDNLREIDFYDWECREKEYLQSKFPASYKAWKQGDPHKLIVYEKESTVHYPLLELWQRADKVWDEIFHAEGIVNKDSIPFGRTVLIVAHGSLGQALLGTAMGWDATYFRQHEYPNCGMAEIQWTDDLSVQEDAARRPLASQWRWKWPMVSNEWNTLKITQQTVE